MIGGRVFDTSALEHFATGRSIYARALVWAAVEQSDVLVVPTTALTAAWARIPLEAYPVLEVLLGLPNTVLEVLDGPTAHQLGLLVATAGGGASWSRATSCGAVGNEDGPSSPTRPARYVSLIPRWKLKSCPDDPFFLLHGEVSVSFFFLRVSYCPVT